MAVILQAVENSVLKPKPGMKKVKKEKIIEEVKEAKEWLSSPNNGMCSLNWYCDLLGIDPGYIRRKVKDYELKLENNPTDCIKKESNA